MRSEKLRCDDNDFEKIISKGGGALVKPTFSVKLTCERSIGIPFFWLDFDFVCLFLKGTAPLT